jgi:integrase
MTFEHYASVYIEIKRTQVKLSTLSKYQNIIGTKLLPYFGDRKINTIKPSDCRVWFARYSERSAKTLRDYASVVSGIFQEAIYDEAITKNPADFLRVPKLCKRNVQPFSSQEVKMIFDAVPIGKFRSYLFIAFYTGMRSGEIMALKKTDIDFENRLIHVSRSRGRFGESSPKTQNGFRLVPILDELLPVLKDLYDSHDKEYLFITRSGQPYKHNETFYQKYWVPLFQKLDIPYRRLYNTRHTFATMMLSEGHCTPYQLSKILGHGDTQMVHQVYVKMIESNDFEFDMSIELY